MTANSLRMGEFPLAQIGAFDFRGEDFLLDSSYYGLDLHESWLIAHLRRTADGQDIHIVRPMMLRTSNGLSFSVGRGGGGVHQDKRGGDFLRGGSFDRTADNNGDLRFSGSSGFWSGGSAQTVEARFGDTASWEDSGHLRLTGRRLGPGMQTHIPSRNGRDSSGICHTGTFYEAEGEVFGDAVSGIVILENAFSPKGKTLTDSSIRRKYVGGWNGFATVFEDGRSQHGHVAYGAGPFRFANIWDDGRHIASEILSIDAEYDEQELGKRVIYHLANGEDWEFVRQTTLVDMLALARSLGSSAQAHRGYLCRVGETRQQRNWYSIQEWFPERMRNDAPDFEEEPPRGF